MKSFNSVQNIYLSIYIICILAIILFVVPFRIYEENSSTIVIHDVIWSQHNKIDLIRLLLYLVAPSLLFVALIKSTANEENKDPVKFKKRLKLEIKKLQLVLISIVLLNSFMGLNNLINNSKINRLEKSLERTKEPVLRLYQKRQTREDFWDSMKWVYDHKSFDNKINRLWEFYEREKENAGWLKYYLSNISTYDIRLYDIDTPEKFKAFIEANQFSEKDYYVMTKLDSIDIEIYELEKALRKPKILSLSQFRIYNLISIAVLFVLMYLIIPVLGGFRNIIREANT